MPRSDKEVETLLKKLQQSMHYANLWSDQSPSTEALRSQLPFAYDLMSFEQWLQFIFIPQMWTLLETDLGLPEEMLLSPMAEQCFAKSPDVIAVIRQIDRCFKHG
jgi:uncharacterized protein YqcC (DUF446 family)